MYVIEPNLLDVGHLDKRCVRGSPEPYGNPALALELEHTLDPRVL